jgi:putative ABC transport system ATP-binding protein
MNDIDNILVAQGLEKCYGRYAKDSRVLRGLDLSVRRGEFVAVMGPSGCGKSTLLHVLGLLTEPDTGSVTIDGQLAASAGVAEEASGWPIVTGVPDEVVTRQIRRRKIGFVFQRFNLINVLTAWDNVAISLRVRGVKDDGQVGRLFKELDVYDVARKKPGQMSIGQQQRVAVVRALAHRPAILLADEPTGNLDSANSVALLEVFGRIKREQGQTVVMITHSAEAAAVADRVVHMKDGRIEQQ